MKPRFFAAAIGVAALMSGAASAQEITGAGASFPFPVYAKWAEAYYKETGNRMNYQSIGSSGGIRQIRGQHLDVDTIGSPEFGGEVLEPLDGAGDENEVVAVTCIAAGIACTKARGGAGDQGDGTGHAATLPAQRW